MLEIEQLLTRIVNKVSAWVAVCSLDQVQAGRGGGRIYTKSGLKEI